MSRWMSSTLPSEIANLWSEYLGAERDHIRAVVTESLARFIDRLLLEESPAWHTWALGTAAAVSDSGADIPVRFPLFERVLLPALEEGVTRGMPGCARWLAHFDQLLCHTRRSVLPERFRTAVGLLNEALRLDAADHRARRRLVQRHAQYLEYTLHALPSGVLYGNHGATISECEELLLLLAEFRGHATLLGETDCYKSLIDECTQYYTTYCDYLRRDQPRGSYEEFIKRNFGMLSEPQRCEGDGGKKGGIDDHQGGRNGPANCGVRKTAGYPAAGRIRAGKDGPVDCGQAQKSSLGLEGVPKHDAHDR